MRSTMLENDKDNQARKELLEILAQAEEDVQNGRVGSVDEMFDELRNLIKNQNE